DSILTVLYNLLKGSAQREAFVMGGTKGIIYSGLNSLKVYLLLPWNMTMRPGIFRDPGAIGLLFLTFLPFVVFPWSDLQELNKMSEK
ncbi:unnamed protein product, partial [marine sediment metagenome]